MALVEVVNKKSDTRLDGRNVEIGETVKVPSALAKVWIVSGRCELRQASEETPINPHLVRGEERWNPPQSPLGKGGRKSDPPQSPLDKGGRKSAGRKKGK